MMEYPIHIDTINMELSILHLKGLSVKISIKCILSLKIGRLIQIFPLSNLCLNYLQRL